MADVALSHEDGIAVLTLQRSPANAMSVEFLEEIVEALRPLAGDPPPALVLTGQDPFFSGGADLKSVPRYGPAEHRRMIHGINQLAIEGYGLPCPVVGAISGHAIAGGMVLALCADLRVASTAGRYGMTEIKVGVPYPQAAIALVAAELAPSAARQLVFSNRLTDSSECVSLGVFDEAVAPEQVLPRAIEIARELAQMPGEVYARTKHDLRGATLESMRERAARDPLLELWPED